MSRRKTKMVRSIKVGLLTCLMLLLVFESKSQDITQAPTSTWFTALNQIKLKNNWSVSFETHERFADALKTQGFFLFRPSIDYKLTPDAILSVGYTFINAQPFEPYSAPIARNENNIWEQILLKQDLGKVNIQHRFRQEHRWTDRIVTDSLGSTLEGTSFSNRFRYRLTVKRDIFKKVFVQVFDEIWINQTKSGLPRNFARNWLYAGLGYSFSDDFNVQLGYMHQFDRVAENSYIATPIIQTTIVYNIGGK